MATRLIPYYVQVTDYDNAGEAALASTLSGASANSVFIFNTQTGKTRVWNGSAFADLTHDPLVNASNLMATNVGGYRTILDTSGSHIAAKVAGTYAMGQGYPLAVSGTGTLDPLKSIFIAGADYPTINGIAPKLRIRAQLYTNDVAPTGNFTFGLYPITRPGTSGGTGVCTFTIGTVVAGSNGASFTTPAADGLLSAVGSDFSLPADGHYIIAVVTTATVATNAHVHLSAQLQIRNA